MEQSDRCVNRSRCANCYADNLCTCVCHQVSRRSAPATLDWQRIIATVGAMCVPCSTGRKCGEHKAAEVDGLELT